MITKFPEKELIIGLIAVISGLIALCTLVWVFIKYPSEKIIGERFVLDEISIIGIAHFKPITIIVSSAFVCWVCTLEALQSYLLSLPIIIKSLIFVFLIFSSFIFSYEIIWNFFAWSEAYILSGGKVHLDMIHHLPSQINPTQPGPYNFVFKTKEFFLYFASSLYGLYFFHGILRIDNISHKNISRERRNP
jgi:hypothetical protein